MWQLYAVAVVTRAIDGDDGDDVDSHVGVVVVQHVDDGDEMDDDDDDGDGADVDADAGDYDEKFAAGVGKVAMPSEASFDVTVAIPLLPLHNNLHHQNRSHNQPSPLKSNY